MHFIRIVKVSDLRADYRTAAQRVTDVSRNHEEPYKLIAAGSVTSFKSLFKKTFLWLELWKVKRPREAGFWHKVLFLLQLLNQSEEDWETLMLGLNSDTFTTTPLIKPVLFVLTVVCEFWQGSAVSDRTQLSCAYWKWGSQHLTPLSSSF